MNSVDWEKITRNKITTHISNVTKHLGAIAHDLKIRGVKHDGSKFDKDEFPHLVQMEIELDRDGELEFDSPEFMERMEKLQPMRVAHYKKNRHHPEHFERGVNDMNLLDIVEMLCDWKDASERHGHDAIQLTKCFERFNISDQLGSIIENTCQDRGWEYE